MKKAIFLDRDGTINEDIGDLYQAEKLKFIPKSFEALKLLQQKYLLFIITNQSGIGKNIFSVIDYEKFNHYFSSLLKNEGIAIQEILHCPHRRDENCLCHKPKTYFIDQLSKKYNIDLNNSFCIGDHPHDIEMAKNAGCGSVYLLTGHGFKHKDELSSKPDSLARDLYEAALWIDSKV